MTRISKPITSDPEEDDEAAIRRTTIQNLRWTVVLVLFLRICAVLCMARGLLYWAELLGLFDLEFLDRPILQQGAIVFFAVIYCFAAVGLWLAAAWGAAVWFIALAGETVFLMLEPGVRFQPTELIVSTDPLRSPGYLLIGLLLVTVYLGLSWLASREDK